MWIFEAPVYSYGGFVADTESQVDVLSACADREGLGITLDHQHYPYMPDCSATSNTSLFVVSIGKRLVAEALIENPNPFHANFGTVTNLCKIYTFTFGLLTWQLEDLSQTFGAECDIQDKTSCTGLQYKLNNKSVLLASVDTLPFSADSYGRIDYFNRGMIHLARVLEAPTAKPISILMLHNIARYEPEKLAPNISICIGWVDDLVRNVLVNHLYIENP